MMLGNGSDKATLDYTMKYNPPMNLAVAEANLKEIKRIQMVVSNGTVYFPSDIYPFFGIEPFAEAPEILAE